MANELPQGWLEGELNWMAQHLDATRLNYQQELQRLLLGVIEIRDLMQRVQASEELRAQSEAWRDCIHAMEQQFGRLLESFGVEALAEMTDVNPEIHHVVGVVDRTGSPGTIAEVLLSGYRWNGSLLRAAEVIACRPPAPPGSTLPPSQGESREIDRH